MYDLKRLEAMGKGELEGLMEQVGRSRGILFFISGNIYNRDGELSCDLCESTDCLHTGYAEPLLPKR